MLTNDTLLGPKIITFMKFIYLMHEKLKYLTLDNFLTNRAI